MKTDERFRIEKIRVLELRLPLAEPFRISTGVLRERRSLIVELHADGAVGYGESAPNEEPFYSEETFGTVCAMYRDLFLPRLRGRSFESIEAFDRELRRGVRGNAFARTGLETAYWDLVSRRNGVPLVDLLRAKIEERLGSKVEARAAVESGLALGIPDDDDPRTLETRIGEFLPHGYRRLKIKVRPGWDAEPLRAARNAAGPEFPLSVDANASYELERDLERLRALDEFGLLYIEQPLHHRDLLDHAKLAKAIRTPLCLDESLEDARAARAALELGSAPVWNIKVQRLGGLSESIEVYALARSAGVKLWGGTMPESGIGLQTILALAAFPGFDYPSDAEPSARWFEAGTDPIEIALAPDGTIAVPRAAGIGELLDRARYERATRVLFEV